MQPGRRRDGETACVDMTCWDAYCWRSFPVWGGHETDSGIITTMYIDRRVGEYLHEPSSDTGCLDFGMCPCKSLKHTHWDKAGSTGAQADDGHRVSTYLVLDADTTVSRGHPSTERSMRDEARRGRAERERSWGEQSGVDGRRQRVLEWRWCCSLPNMARRRGWDR